MKHFLPFAILSIALACSSCGKQSGPVEITETRSTPAAPPASQGPAMPPAAGQSESGRHYQWTVPEGWVEAPPTSMRVGNFRIGEDKQTECYVTVLKGAGGGTEMNINRWRGQMGPGNEPLSTEAIAQLPKISMLGKEAPLVELAGTYQGMMGESKAGYMLLGTICELDGESVFVKMIGPENSVKEQRDKFAAFCGSIK